MNYRRLSIEERSCMRKYYAEGVRYREITRRIGRDVSTVLRKIRRNRLHLQDIPTYYPHTAQKKYLLQRSYCHRGMFHSQEVRLRRGQAAGNMVAGTDELWKIPAAGQVCRSKKINAASSLPALRRSLWAEPPFWRQAARYSRTA